MIQEGPNKASGFQDVIKNHSVGYTIAYEDNELQ